MSRSNLPLAKLSRPSSLDVEHRARLFAPLDDCMARPVVWVAGPPGAGKTTLVAGYLRARGLQGIWYQVDAGDGDPAALFHYLGLAIQHVASRQRRPMPALLAEYLTDIAGFARRWFRDFFRVCLRLHCWSWTTTRTLPAGRRFTRWSK